MLCQCSQSPILLTLDSLGKSATLAISKDKTWREVGWGAIRPSDASARLANGARRRQGSSCATHARAGLRILFWGKTGPAPVDRRQPETRLNLHLAQIAFGSTGPCRRAR